MKHVIAAAAALFLAACASQDEETYAGAVDIIDNSGKSIGTGTLTEVPEGVRIVLHLKGLKPGLRAMHIHENGLCHANEKEPFKSAGAHFNPFGKKHGIANEDGPHAGDLPNFQVKADGTAHIDVIARLVTLKEGPANSLFKEGGTCIVIHEQPDDNKTDPDGKAGKRLACGAITKSRAAKPGEP